MRSSMAGVPVRKPANWLGRENPFNMPAPPQWWLQRLAERDSELRVLPGLAEPCYRIGRVSGAMNRVKPILGNDSETGRMCREGLIPIVSLRPVADWNDSFFVWLDEHDTWLAGGADKFVDKLEAQEAAAAETADRLAADEADQRSSAAFFAAKLREGAMAFVQGAPVTNSAG